MPEKKTWCGVGCVSSWITSDEISVPGMTFRNHAFWDTMLSCHIAARCSGRGCARGEGKKIAWTIAKTGNCCFFYKILSFTVSQSPCRSRRFVWKRCRRCDHPVRCDNSFDHELVDVVFMIKDTPSTLAFACYYIISSKMILNKTDNPVDVDITTGMREKTTLISAR